MISVVAASDLFGVSTRRMEGLVQQLGITSLSKSQVPEMARDLDGQVAALRTRPLDAGPCRFVAADALTMKVREGGRVVKVAVMVATGVKADGHCEVLGLQVASVEDGAGWLAFWRDLTARGLTGVKRSVDGGSRRSSRGPATRSRTDSDEAAAAAGRRASAASATAAATSPNAPSAARSNGGASPPATTSSPSSTAGAVLNAICQWLRREEARPSSNQPRRSTT